MLQFDFLEAANGQPLTKAFRMIDGKIDVEPYPFVYEINSHRETAEDLEQLFAQIQYHASLGHCLLKGLLREQLVSRSRAGMTMPDTPTQWVLLDLDFDDGWTSIDAFIAELNPDWADVSYIFQHSSSAGIKSKPGLRGHIWILLDEPVAPSVLKLWLRERNLQIPLLSSRMELAANGLTVKWPLDITTCQNDKLIYIAPPWLGPGIKDELQGKRFELVRKDRERGAPPRLATTPASIDVLTQQKTDRLREAQGLKPRSATIKPWGSIDLLTNPDRAAVTGVKTARGFTYLNLNGGDSWAYYFPERKPDLVYNFKGEPVVRLRDIDPEFYAKYTEQLNQNRYGDLHPYVFRERGRDAYFNVLHHVDTGEVEIDITSSKQKLDDFMRQYGKYLPDPIEDWEVVFDPTNIEIIRPNDKWLNLFQPTDYIRYASNLTKTDEIPPVISKILWSICGDQETLDHFLNWLAFIFQTRQRANTAWVFHGVQGTGKGLLLSKVLRPLFGSKHVIEWTTQNLEDQFNAQLETAIFCWMDEFLVSSAKQATMVMNKLKNYVTEEEITIRGMRQNAFQTRNWMNVIIATNHPDPIQLPEHDRRFNVAPPQETPLKLRQEEVDSIEDELPAFASFLYHYSVDAQKARTVLLNDARANMIQAAQSSHERLFQAVRQGDLDWFMDFLRESIPLSDTMYYQQFETALANWARYALNDELVPVSRDELLSVYIYIVGHGMTPAKFVRTCHIQRLRPTRINRGGRSITGFLIPFRGDKDRMKELLNDSSSKPRLTMVKE